MPDSLAAIADARAQMDARLTKKAWEDDDFRRRFLADPKGMIAEFVGQSLPDSLSVSVHEEGAGNLHFVIPAKPSPQALEDLSDADLEQIAGGTDPVTITMFLTISAAFVTPPVLLALTATAMLVDDAAHGRKW
jgi:hypothetical protein